MRKATPDAASKSSVEPPGARNAGEPRLPEREAASLLGLARPGPSCPEASGYGPGTAAQDLDSLASLGVPPREAPAELFRCPTCGWVPEEQTGLRRIADRHWMRCRGTPAPTTNKAAYRSAASTRANLGAGESKRDRGARKHTAWLAGLAPADREAACDPALDCPFAHPTARAQTWRYACRKCSRVADLCNFRRDPCKARPPGGGTTNDWRARVGAKLDRGPGAPVRDSAARRRYNQQYYSDHRTKLVRAEQKRYWADPDTYRERARKRQPRQRERRREVREARRAAAKAKARTAARASTKASARASGRARAATQPRAKAAARS